MRLNAGVAAITRTCSIAADPPRVWAALSDFGALASWAPNVDHSCLLEHRPDPLGTTRRVQVGRNTLVERITEFTPPTTLGYDIEGFPSRLRHVANRWALTPSAGGRTTVTLTTVVNIGANSLAHLAERAVCRMMAKQSDVMLDGLKAHLEGSP